MAKIGEGDPRWIVSNRDDGKNVNSWHWEEKDLSKSSHEALKELFKGAVVVEQEGDVTNFKFSELSEIDGDITVAQRKGKIMCYFEVKMTAKWEATVNGSKVEGKISAPEVEHDNFGEEFELKVSTVERSGDALKAEAVAQKAGRKAFRAIIKKFFDAIFTQYAVGTKVPSQQVAGGSAQQPAAVPISVSSSTFSSNRASTSPTAHIKTTGSGPAKGASMTTKSNSNPPKNAKGITVAQAIGVISIPILVAAAFAYMSRH